MVSAVASSSDEKTRRCVEGQSRSAVSVDVDVDVDVADGRKKKRERNSEEIKNLAGCSKRIFVCSSLSLAEEEQAWRRRKAPKVEGRSEKSGRRRLRYLERARPPLLFFLTFLNINREQNKRHKKSTMDIKKTIDV